MQGYITDPYEVMHRNAHQYMGNQRGRILTSIDIDGVEYCWACGTFIALIERTRSWLPKCTTVTQNMAQKLGIPSYLVRYKEDLEETDDHRLWVTDLPHRFSETPMTPTEYLDFLWELRYQHWINDGCRGSEWALTLPRKTP